MNHKWEFKGTVNKGKQETDDELYHCTRCGAWKMRGESCLKSVTEECKGEKVNEPDKKDLRMGSEEVNERITAERDKAGYSVHPEGGEDSTTEETEDGTYEGDKAPF